MRRLVLHQVCTAAVTIPHTPRKIAAAPTLMNSSMARFTDRCHLYLRSEGLVMIDEAYDHVEMDSAHVLMQSDLYPKLAPA